MPATKHLKRCDVLLTLMRLIRECDASADAFASDNCDAIANDRRAQARGMLRAAEAIIGMPVVLVPEAQEPAAPIRRPMSARLTRPAHQVVADVPSYLPHAA
jgi:hypothetical protein